MDKETKQYRRAVLDVRDLEYLFKLLSETPPKNEMFQDQHKQIKKYLFGLGNFIYACDSKGEYIHAVNGKK